MNLLMIVALKKIYDDNQAAARRRRRAYESSRKKNNAPKDHNHRYSSKEYSENDYFNMVVTEDEVLTAFFKALEAKGKEINDREAEVVRKVVEEKLKAQCERVAEIDKTFEEIKAAGLDIKIDENEYFYYRTTVGQKVLDAGEKAFGDRGEYAKVTRAFQLKYKGITLAREWFNVDKFEENPFDKRLAAWQEKNPDIENQINAKKEEIASAERKLKYALFKKEEKADDIEKLKEELERLVAIEEEGKRIANQRDIFAEITPEQKVLLNKYFKQVAECKEAGKDVDIDIRKYLQIKDDSYRYSYSKEEQEKENNKWERAIEELIANGDASEELLDAIDTILSEEAIGYEKYYEGKDSYQMQREGFSNTFTKLIGWYIESRREKITTKAVERREQAYLALGKEHKKLVELSGLVDEAKALEEAEDKKSKGVKGDEEHGEE